MAKIIYVNKGDKRLRGFDSYAHYQSNTIYVKRGQSRIDTQSGIEHEKCHMRLRKAHPRTHIRFSPTAEREMSNMSWWKTWKKDGTYNREKLPEEVFCELYGMLKSGQISRTEFRRKLQDKYPHAYAEINRRLNRMGI